jgi:hypothetical protein
MRTTFISIVAVMVFFLDGWGATLAGLLLLAIHWDYLCGAAADAGEKVLSLDAAGVQQDLSEEIHALARWACGLANRMTLGWRLRHDPHARADARVAFQVVVGKRGGRPKGFSPPPAKVETMDRFDAHRSTSGVLVEKKAIHAASIR